MMYNTLAKSGRRLRPQCRAQSSLPQPIRNPKLPTTKLFINNEWVDAASRKTIKSISPVTEEVITEFAHAGEGDVDKAVAAAKEAFKIGSPWRTMDASRRGYLIYKLASLMERDAALITSLETMDSGKVYSATYRGEVKWGIKTMKYYAGFTDKLNGESSAVDGPYLAYTRREPVGVVGSIIAWNYTNYILSGKLSSALAAGCTTVLKPSQHSCLSVLHVAELAKEAGFPPGVINVVTGPGAVGGYLCDHPDVDAISFTGSTPVGQDIYRKGSKNMKRLILELGGKSPNIILQDADIDAAVEHAHYATFLNVGQCCSAGARTFVHEAIYEQFVQKMKERIERKKIGDPFDLSVDHGPQATKEQADSIMKYIDIGKKEGAKLVIGGNRVQRKGYFVEPTVFSDVTDDMTIAKEEIFGPVMPILPFKNVDEMVERANKTEYGLASSVFGSNIDDINTLVQGIRAGSVWVNCFYLITPQLPFGGFKMSGIGRESGREGVLAFTETKTVYVKTPTKNS